MVLPRDPIPKDSAIVSLNEKRKSGLRIIPDSLRLGLGKKYLDWAEKLRRFRGGTVAYLQDTREYQRSKSEREYQETRPPQGTAIEYLYFCLIEMFHFEDFERLRDGIFRLFPELNDPFRLWGSSTDLVQRTGSIFGGGWGKLGIIVRERKARLVRTFPLREIPELPPEVDTISLELHQTFPSVSFLSLKVHLTEKATQHLLALQNRHYLSVIRFRRLIPWGILRCGHSEEPSSIVRRKEILRWQNDLRGKIEACIEPYLSGHFMQRPSKQGRLPAIDVFALKGIPEGKEAFDKWKETARRWCDSLALDLYPFDTYQSERLLFVWPTRDPEFGRPPYRLLVLWEPYLKSVKTEHFGGSEKEAVAYYTGDTLRGMLPTITVLRFLESVEKNIEKLRRDVFQGMKSRPLFWHRLGSYIKLADAVQRESMLLDRFFMEFEQKKELVRHEMGEAGNLKASGPASGSEGERNLRDVTVGAVGFFSERLKQHASLVTNSFSQYLTIRNIDAMYRLQRKILWLTIIVVALTIVGLVANWEKLSKILHTWFS